MKEQQYTRKGSVIRDMDNNVVFESPKGFVNEAKRESRRLQLESDGALGLGTLRVKRN